MRRWTEGLLLPLTGCLVLAVGLASCTADRTPDLETRTFDLVHLEDHAAMEMLSPYVYFQREGAPGGMTVVDGKLTVRETPDNLRRIEEALAQFDRPKPTVRLSFQIIEANGATETDPRIAEVEEALRRLFLFEGYRLVGEVMVHATEGNQVFQEFTVPDLGPSAIEAIVRNVRTEAEGGSVQLEVRFHAGQRTVFGTTVRVRAGQTAVLGRSPSAVSGRNLILAVKPDLIELH